MNAPLPFILIAGLTLLLPARAQAQESGASTKASVTITDRSGDTVNDDNSAPLKAPRGDIVSAALEYPADQVRLTAQLSQPSDPLSDGHWVSDSTFLEWELDTTADGKPDYLAEFGSEGGHLYGLVIRPTDPADAPAACRASMAAYSASSGYVLGLPPACLGAPKAISFRVTMYYDTNPNDDKAPVATDVAPDKGLAGPAAVASGATSTTSPASIASPDGAQTAATPPAGGGSTPTAGSPSSAERGTPASPSPGAPSGSPSAGSPSAGSPSAGSPSAGPGQAAPQTSTSVSPSPRGHVDAVAGSPAASAGQPSLGSPSALRPTTHSSGETAGSVAARVGPGQPFEERKGTVALVAIVAVLLAWAGLVMVLARGRRLRTAAL